MKTRLAVLALALSTIACSGPEAPEAAKPVAKTFALWETTDTYDARNHSTGTEIRIIEGDLDRVACELIQSKEAARQQRADALAIDLQRQLAAYGRAVASEPLRVTRYICIATGRQPTTEGPARLRE
jgi:hypothetical protein